jgi:thiamine biosynthesis lipoprotein
MKKLLATILSVIIIGLTGCTKKTVMDFETLRFLGAFGGIGVDVTIISSEERIKNDLEEVYEDINQMLIDFDNVFSINHTELQVETVIQKVNRLSGVEPVVVPEEVIYVIEKALEVSEKSLDENGVAQYDITIEPLWSEWKFIEYMGSVDIAPIPTQERLNELIPLVDYKKIKINKETSTVYLEEEGMGIDLGSIAKGYAADKIREYLISKDFTRALINVGGNLITMGESYLFSEETDIPWKIMITTPYQLAGMGGNYYIGHFNDTDRTTVTSGVYERYYTVDDIAYHHILDPGTGLPRDSDLLSLTIITDNSMVADAFSTTIFSLGLVEGLKLVEQTDNMEAVAITEDKKVWITSGMEGNFVFNEKTTDLRYEYMGVKK